MMDDRNNPYGGNNYFGMQNNLAPFQPERHPTAAESQRQAPVSFEDVNSRSARSVDIGSINTAGNQIPPAQPAKKKFVVHFDDAEDFGQSNTPATGVNRGGIYFTGRQQTHNANPNSAPNTVNQQSTQYEHQKNSAQGQSSSFNPPKTHPASIPISGGRRVNRSNSAGGVPVTPSSSQGQGNTPIPPTKNKVRSKGKSFLVFVAVVLICSTLISLLGISCVNDVLAIGRNEESVVVNIPNDADASDVIDILADNKLIHQPFFCKFLYRLKNAIFNKPNDMSYVSAFMSGAVDDEPVFLSGVYYVDADMGLEGYLNKFQREQVAEKTINVFFPEGWSIYQMFDKLDNFGVCKKSELVAALEGADYEYAFMNNIQDSDNRVFKLEGYMFPDTYEFYETCDANTIIRKMLGNFESKWTAEYDARAKELGLTMDEVITLASIIQREAANKEQMGVVSSVLHNRLKNSVSFPTLGCDSTRNYVENNVLPNVSSADGQKYLAAYDTYAIKGLPAGPVCNPGIDAIEAALWPDDTNYLYFCHDNSGTIYLAYTNEEHDRNLLEVLRKNNG